MTTPDSSGAFATIPAVAAVSVCASSVSLRPRLRGVRVLRVLRVAAVLELLVVVVVLITGAGPPI